MRIALVAVLAAGAGACGDKTTEQTAGQTATTVAAATTSTVAGHPAIAAMDLTTTDGYRYRISLEFGPPSPTGAADACAGPPSPGKVYFPLILTIANSAADKAAPFPPVRIEQTAAPGTKPAQVQVKGADGTCTFAPRQPSIAAGQSAVFKGSTPAVDAVAPHGSAGQISVKVSETTFDLSVPLP